MTQSPVWRRRAAALIAVACLVAVALAPAFAARHRRHSTGSVYARQRANTQAKARVQARLRAVERQRRIAGQQLHESERRVGQARSKLISLKQRLGAARQELASATTALRGAEIRLAGHEQAMGERLNLLAQYSDVSMLEVLARSTSFSDFANRRYLMRVVADADLELLGKVRADRERVSLYRNRVQAKTSQVGELKDQAAQQHQVYLDETAHHARTVRELDAERRRIRAELAELERNNREIEALIRRMQRSPEGRARYLRPWRGSLLRPVSGPQTSGFGMRFHPILREYRMHTGVDLAAAPGTPIRAADKGVVILAGWHGGYGLRVVIDHGGGVSTLYGHCSRLLCAVGQQVAKGQVIAAVGSTGLSTGPHLHFEVRRSGVPVDPGSI